jgi:hypothetical protein
MSSCLILGWDLPRTCAYALQYFCLAQAYVRTCISTVYMRVYKFRPFNSLRSTSSSRRARICTSLGYVRALELTKTGVNFDHARFGMNKKKEIVRADVTLPPTHLSRDDLPTRTDLWRGIVFYDLFSGSSRSPRPLSTCAC